MASKRKVALSDYEMTTTLGTGKLMRVDVCRVFWESEAVSPQENGRVLCHEDPQKGRHHQAQAGRSRYLRKHHSR